MARMLQGIETREGTRGTHYRGYAYDPVARKPRRGTWTTSLSDARRERLDLLRAVDDQALGDSHLTFEDAVAAFIQGAKTGSIRNRSGDEYKPSVVNSYAESIKLYIMPELGPRKLDAIKRRELQAIVDRLALTHSPSTIRNAINPVRSLYRWADSLDMVRTDPTVGLRLPAVRSKRKVALAKETVQAMIAAVPRQDRAPWAIAFYAGLRAGELAALRWEDMDFDAGLIRVRRSYDWRSKEDVTTKSRSGVRDAPMIPALADALKPHQTTGLVCPGPKGRLYLCGLYGRSKKAWKGTHPVITLHGARHCYASLMIGAGVDLGSVSEYIGHSSIATTSDIYRHLLPDAHQTDAAKLAAFLA